jgi:hypothetical protein
MGIKGQQQLFPWEINGQKRPETVGSDDETMGPLVTRLIKIFIVIFIFFQGI